MRDFLRFYIVAANPSETIWAEIRDFIESVENIRKDNKDNSTGFRYTHLEIFSDTETKGIITKDEEGEAQKYYKQKSRGFGKRVDHESFLSEDIRERLKSYNIVDFVIILKLEGKFIDFKQLIPFFLIHEKSSNTSMGIDFNGIEDKEIRNHLVFSIGQFLWNWKTAASLHAKQLLYFIHDGEIKDKAGKTLKIELGRLPTQDDIVLRRFSPLIEINKSIFDELFVNTLSKTVASLEPGLDDKNSLRHLKADHFPIEKEKVDIKNLFLRRYIDFKAKANPSDELEDLFFNNLKNEPFIAFYLMIMVLDQLMLEKSGSENRGLKWRKALGELFEEKKILNYIVLIRRYATGLREVAENIIFHTPQKRGYFYFVLKKSDEYSPDLESDPGLLIQERRFKYLYMNRYHDRMKCLPDRFLEVVLLDMSKVGIIQSYRTRLQTKQKEERVADLEDINLEVPNLEDFYVGKFSRLPGLSHLDMRYLAQLGLKTFAAIIKNKRGYFEVETNSDTGKQRLIYFRNIKEIKPDKGKWFDEDVQKSIGDGTHYDILLPLSEILIQDEEVAGTTYEVKSFIELFERWLHSEDEKEPVITDFSDFDDFSVVAYPKKDMYVEKIGEKIVEHYQKNKVSNALSVDFERVRRKSIDFSTFIKILSYAQLAKNINHIIIYNLDQDSFGQMMNQLRILAGFEKFWNNHSWLYLYDENGVPFIINGEDAAACDRLNKMVELHYGYCYTILGESRDIAPVQTGEYKILPYELLINTTYRGQIPVSLFEKNVYCILEKEIEGNELGVKIKDAHMRLGSEIHLDNFYEAEVLFHDNFYVERFAYLAARDILLRRRNKNRVLLVGYGSFSEMFLNRTKHILNYEAQAIKDSRELDICPVYFICNDVEELKWQGLERIENIDTGEEFDFALLVPVASSLNTNYKIVKSFKNEAGGVARRNDFFEEDKLIFNAAIILIRDRIEDKPTEKERSYNWESIDNTGKTITTTHFKNPIKFYVCEGGGWNRPINCSPCFPDLYGNDGLGKLTDEEILLETTKASINPKLILGWPKVEKIEFEAERERVERFKDCIKYGHIKTHSNHHLLYYVDTLKFFENQKNKQAVRQWLEQIRKDILGGYDAYNIIVSRLRHSNTGFINMVNDTIFNGTATIIILDLNQEFVENMITKYSYLRALKGKIKFHFVDDSILTGGNFIMARGIVSSIFQKFNGLKEEGMNNVEIFSSIIVLLNRLPVYRKKNLIKPMSRIKTIEYNQDESHVEDTTFKSYVTLLIPSIRDPEAFCFICRYKEEYEKLSKYSVLDKLKSHFNLKAKDLEEKMEFRVDYAESRIYNRLFLTHQIYYMLSRVNEDKEYEGVIEKVWNLRENIQFKIDVIRVLSSPLLSYYKNIEKIVFKKLLTELNRLIDKIKNEIDVFDFNLMLTLMKQLTQLKSSFIIRDKNIERIWRFYANYKLKFKDLYEGLYEVARFPEDLRLVAEILKYEKKLEEIKNGPVLEIDRPVIERKIRESNEKIKEIPKKDVENVKQDLKKLVDKLGTWDSKMVSKTISNLAEFKFSYVIMIKMLVQSDEARSLWLEYLFRTGKELPENFSESQYIPVNKPYNDLHRKFNHDPVISDIINKDYKDFYVLVKLENVTILKRALNRFVNESYHKTLEEKIRGNKFRIDHLDVEGEFNTFREKIHSEYYYEYLRKFVPDSDQGVYRKIFNLYLLQMYLRLLASPEMQTNLTIEEEFGEITKMLADIMDADGGFFTIRKFRTDEKELYTIGRSNIGTNEIPFELTPGYFTYSCVNNEEKWYSFFAPQIDEWSGLEKNNASASAIIVIRFFRSLALKEGELNPTGGITFLYKDKYDEVKRAQIKENIRYVMLIKEDIQTLLEKNFDNENFNAWIETKKRDMFSTEYFRKIYHGAHKDIRTLQDAIDLNRGKNISIEERIKGMDFAFAYSWIIDAQVSIGHLYSKYTMGQLSDEIETSQGPFDNSNDIFSSEFKDVLKILGDHNKFKIEYRLKPGLRTIIWKDHLRFFIIEILYNYIKLKFDDNGKIIIGEDSQNRLFIETHGSATQRISLERIMKNINLIRPVSSGIGLFTINKCINVYCGKNIEIIIDKEKRIFKTIIPISQEE